MEAHESVCTLYNSRKKSERDKLALPHSKKHSGGCHNHHCAQHWTPNNDFRQVKFAQVSQNVTPYIFIFYEFLFERLQFGTSSAAGSLQRKVNDILEGSLGVPYDMKHILDAGARWKEHDEMLEERPNRLKVSGVGLNKCDFKRITVRPLGHVISQEGITSD